MVRISLSPVLGTDVGEVRGRYSTFKNVLEDVQRPKQGGCLSLYTDYECKSELREKVRNDVRIWT
jgi:hypothetical protein